MKYKELINEVLEDLNKSEEDVRELLFVYNSNPIYKCTPTFLRLKKDFDKINDDKNRLLEISANCDYESKDIVLNLLKIINNIFALKPLVEETITKLK